MSRSWRFGCTLAVLLCGSAVAQAQGVPQPLPAEVPPPVPPPLPADPAGPRTAAVPGAPTTGPRAGLESHSLPAETAEDIRQPPAPPRLGPTPVDQVGFLQNLLSPIPAFRDGTVKAFGWVEAGHTFAKGRGPLAVQPRLNRFGDEFLVNQIGLTLEKPLAQDRFDWGFNVRYFAGADAATGQPRGGIDDPPGDPRFSHDFRDLNLTAHLPVLTDGGVNVKVGRMNTIIGWNGYLAPYRPLYSSDYQFFYSQDGAFTGALAQLVVSDRLDIWSGVTFGANTFFEKRSPESVCYIGQVNYWLQAEKRTRLTASTYVGPNAIFAAPGLAGDFVTMVELRVQHNWSERFTQVVQANLGWDDDTPVGTGSWYGVYTVGIYHLNPQLDLIGRAEWFKDFRGTRTGVDTDYAEVTLGLNWHPTPWFELRPEVRGDFAGRPAFGGSSGRRDEGQITGAISCLFKF